MPTFGQQVINFHQSLHFSSALPRGIKVMNPVEENDEIIENIKRFYTKFFGDHRSRRFLIGINPGRFGAGQTGLPFTDTKRLAENCGLPPVSFSSHEPSSVFIYEMINAFGGVQAFYKQFYINSVCPLGFIQRNKKGNWVNCNYYDFPELFEALKPFIVTTLKKQITFGIDTSVCYSLGKKNAKFLSKINAEEHLFEKIVPLPHPRYVIQYKFKEKDTFIMAYLQKLMGL